MNFSEFKKVVMSLARIKKITYLVPNNDILFGLWEKKVTPEQVIEKHCTLEASRKRHEMYSRNDSPAS